MKKTISKTEAKEKIDSFFENNNFSPEDLKKVKRLAMKYKIKFTNYSKSFCKSCLSPLKGRISISKTHKIVECESCGFKNSINISLQKN